MQRHECAEIDFSAILRQYIERTTQEEREKMFFSEAELASCTAALADIRAKKDASLEAGRVHMMFSKYATEAVPCLQEHGVFPVAYGYTLLKDVKACPEAVDLFNTAMEKMEIGSMGSAFTEWFDYNNKRVKVTLTPRKNPLTGEPVDISLDICEVSDY